MGIHLSRVGHIGIHVSDVDRSINFYRKVLGLKVSAAICALMSARPKFYVVV